MLETLLVGGLIVGGLAASGTFSGGPAGSSLKMPSLAAASNTAKTAAPTAISQMSEEEKLSKRLAASQLTKDWGKLTLSKPGLLGFGAVQ